MSRVLLAGQEASTVSFLTKGLQASGFTMTVADGVDAALPAARSSQFDLLVLDLAPPGQDGTAALTALRQAPLSIPVIVITTQQGIEKAVATLHGGSDDFMTKPLCFEELLARVRLRLRGDQVPETTVLRHGPLELDLRTRQVRVDGRPVDLTAREFLLTEAFVHNHDLVLSRQQLLAHVWGYRHDTGSNVVDVYVCSLRRKLGRGLITTVRGMGYRLVAATPEQFGEFGSADRLTSVSG